MAEDFFKRLFKLKQHQRTSKPSKHQHSTLLNLQLKLHSVKSLNRYREILFRSSFIVLIFCSRLAVSFHFHSSFGDSFSSLLAEIIICCLDFLFLIRNVSSFCCWTLRCSLLFEKFSPPWRKGFNLSSFESTMRSLCQLYLLSFHTRRNQHFTKQTKRWVGGGAGVTRRFENVYHSCICYARVFRKCTRNRKFCTPFPSVCRIMYTNEILKGSSLHVSFSLWYWKFSLEKLLTAIHKLTRYELCINMDLRRNMTATVIIRLSMLFSSELEEMCTCSCLFFSLFGFVQRGHIKF